MSERQQNDANSPNSKQPQTAFLQVPIDIREEVEAYIRKLTENRDTIPSTDSEPLIEPASQGCFLVISLDKIELLIGRLESCLTTVPNSGAENIKQQIREVLHLLQ